jgi:hypothetical protein
MQGVVTILMRQRVNGKWPCSSDGNITPRQGRNPNAFHLLAPLLSFSDDAGATGLPVPNQK